MCEKGFNFNRTHLLRMSLVVKQDEATNPLHIGFFSTVGIVPHPNCVAHLIQRLLEKLGFQSQGLLKKRGFWKEEHHDLEEFRLMKSEFTAV